MQNRLSFSVWRWGLDKANIPKWSFLRSGAATGEIATKPTKAVEALPSVESASAGAEHCAFVSEGRVFTFGTNRYYQLGRSTGSDSADHEARPVEIEGNPNIVQVACGTTYTLALCEGGDVFSWGWGGTFISGATALGHGNRAQQEKPKLVESLRSNADPVKYIGSGCQHALAITQNNKLYSCGKGEFGRLGVGSNGDQTLFEQVDFFDTVKPPVEFVKVAAGMNHSIALTANGEVYVWGKNDRGQLGTGEGPIDLYSCETYPRHLRSLVLEGVQIKDIAAGDDFTVAVSTSGVIYNWGRGLWLEPQAVTLNPSFENAAIRGAVLQVDGGANYCAAVTEEGELYTWGKRKSGCLARENAARESGDPVLVPSESTFNGELVTHVACGRYRCMAITSGNAEAT